ncbi:RNA-binding protein [Capnocytophaga canimorsus]|uniref:RNA-binding protein n=1 Tax=Capnocytophaga canimorsus TaxID=28188 RepID=A0A250G189_9FLAO|nr:DUF721 domain-containing protein [Capnocytophaga canimorsus]ATA91152.1 RNA-binding protein [Capnocytophaga canimorsus]
MDGNSKSLADILKFIVKENKLDYGIRKVRVREAWQELMGVPINKYTSSVELKGEVLYVTLTSAALREELSYGKEKIINMLNENLGEKAIEKLIFM